MRNGFKFILSFMTIAWLMAVAMIYYYSDGIGPGVYMSGAMVGLTWAVWYFMD